MSMREATNHLFTRTIMPLLFLGVTAGPSLAIAASEMPPLNATRWVNSTPLIPPKRCAARSF